MDSSVLMLIEREVLSNGTISEYHRSKDGRRNRWLMMWDEPEEYRLLGVR